MMNVYFTVDTESSMGGALVHPERRPLTADRHIFCRIQGQDYGIGLITRILGQYGFRATYFVEMLATLVNGDEDTRSVFDYLLDQGQDVQLHIHPIFLYYCEQMNTAAAGKANGRSQKTDFMGALAEERQTELLEQACELYRQFTGSRPAAFRAGCYAANRTTLKCLHKAGILLDTSFNPCYRKWSFAGEDLEPNRVCEIEGVWEIPVTVARSPLPEGHGGFKPADPCSLSVAELQAMLETGAARGQRHFVIVFHSFSAVKTTDETYRKMRPDRIVIRRLEKLMEYLSQHQDLYRVSTFGELAAGLSELKPTPAPVAELGLAAAGLRKSVQGLNRYYWF